MDFNEALDKADIVIMTLALCAQIVALALNISAAKITRGIWKLCFLNTSLLLTIYTVANLVRLFTDVNLVRWSSVMLGVSLPVWLIGPWSLFALTTMIEHKKVTRVRGVTREEGDDS